MQSLILKPPYEHSCERCQNWKRYPPYDGQQQTWGRCQVKEVPQYMQETYFSRGCNLHSSMEKPVEKAKKQTAIADQITLF